MNTTTITALDERKLAEYLEKHIPGFRGPFAAEKFSGGQSNPTFLLRAQSGNYVLRRKPSGQLLASAHAVDREFRVLSALSDTAVPVAEPLHLCEDDSVLGSMFYVMRHVPGRIFWDPSLPELPPGERAGYYHELVRVLAALHEVDIEAAGLSDYGKPGNYFERQVSRWVKQYRASETETLEDMEKLIQWLPQNIPEEDGQVSLIHGDYRFDNFIFDAPKLRVAAVLDWELSTLGHPFADLAYFCMCLRLPATGFPQGLGGFDREALDVPSEQEIVARYCTLRGIEPPQNWRFYLAFSFFRLAAICQGVMKRALDGNASNDRALETGRQTYVLAAFGAAQMR